MVLTIGMSNSGVYYALVLNIGTLPGSDVLNNLINNFAEVPAILATLLLDSKHVGRRGLLSYLMIACAIFFGLSTVFVDLSKCRRSESISNLIGYYSVAGQVFAYAAKMCSVAALTTDYVITGEIYPSHLRSTSIAVCSMISRLGLIVLPFVLDLSKIVSWLPGLLITCLARMLVAKC